MVQGLRARGPVAPGHHRRRQSPTALLGEFVVLALAGFLFVTSATTANGTQLRSDRADAAGLLRAEQSRYNAQADRSAALWQEVQALTTRAGAGDSAVAALQEKSQGLMMAAGMEAVHGPGLTITLDDSPRTGPLPANVRPDDLVVHQQDVQAVVNALWSGGAEAIQLMDQRVIATSAVRCVGNTLILQGRVYSPPYRVTAIGDVPSMLRALGNSPEIDIYQQYVQALGLGWSVVQHPSVTVPAFTSSLELRYARVPGADGPTGTATVTGSTATGTTGTGTAPAGTGPGSISTRRGGSATVTPPGAGTTSP
ncbi:MAG TPA: DUF881 domain-containing protein [Kineosporiaceae bacterium]|nr:DUF881 domain-containing protein [Kineosporiaceae bacterium]